MWPVYCQSTGTPKPKDQSTQSTSLLPPYYNMAQVCTNASPLVEDQPLSKLPLLYSQTLLHLSTNAARTGIAVAGGTSYMQDSQIRMSAEAFIHLEGASAVAAHAAIGADGDRWDSLRGLKKVPRAKCSHLLRGVLYITLILRILQKAAMYSAFLKQIDPNTYAFRCTHGHYIVCCPKCISFWCAR